MNAHWPLRVAGLTLMALALALPLMRAPERAVESLVARWAQPPSRFIELPGGQLIHLRDEGLRGDATPVVLLHEWSSSLHSFDAWAATLAHQHRVLRLDLPGNGLSGPPDGAGGNAGGEAGEADSTNHPTDHPTAYGAVAQARAVAAVLAAEGIARAVLVGHGHGAAVALHLAAQQPQQVAALALIAPPASALPAPAQVPSGRQPAGWLLMRLPPVRWVAPELLPRPLVVAGLQQWVADSHTISSQQVDRYFELATRSGNRTALAQWLALPPTPAPAASQPTLLLWGDQDSSTPPAQAAAWQALLPQARLHTWPGVGHLPQEEAPAATLPALQTWLDMLP